MPFLLSSQNVFDYLEELGFCSAMDKNAIQTEQKFAKNFNLLLSLPTQQKLLIKQERYDQEGKTAGEFQKEWRIREFLQQFPELAHLYSLISKALYFDAEHSIIVFEYLEQYRDLSDFYAKEHQFPIAIARAIGTALALIHRSTFNCAAYREFFTQRQQAASADQTRRLTRGLERIGPDIFGSVPAEGLKFFVLYQRFASLGQAVAALGNRFTPCCLTHNDLKLNNILLHNDWLTLSDAKAEDAPVRFIDWERAAWGDPASDLGWLLASYLQIWLGSLVVSREIAIEEALRLAITPLEILQPSLKELTHAYFMGFPEILEHRPDFLECSIQFAGLSLIQQIQATIQYQKTFGNTEICMLQVAKSLLCHPRQSIPTVLGIIESAPLYSASA